MLPRTAAAHNRQAVQDDLRPLLADIRSLIEAPTTGGDAPRLDELEETLTAGYARALALEAESLRLERRLGELATTVARDASGGTADELADVAHRLAASEGEVARLRELLSTLRNRVTAVRAAAAVPS